MLDQIRAGLAAHYDETLVDELLAAYIEAKENFYLGGLRLAEVEGGRFCDAAFRMLEQDLRSGGFTPLGASLSTEQLIESLRSTAASALDESLRLHIPRALRVVYDIRNKRDVAHLADDIDPNLQDATLVAASLDWVLAEFVRRHHGVSADEAQMIIESIVERKAPVVQDFDGFLKVLNPDLSAGDHLTLLLYQCAGRGATYEELSTWSKPVMRSNLRRSIYRLVNDRAFVHDDGNRFKITRAGVRYVEDAGLIHP